MSTAQDVYISPKQIISYLIDFEKRLPSPHKDYYLTSLKTLPITEYELNQEAQKMMNFLGLTCYKPKCKFQVLKDGVGGNTCCCNSNIEVEINVSSKYQHNLEACLAVLAHEVCHKYLYVHGIHYTIEIVNEIYTDLCTMYVGFGDIIKKGYITETRREERNEDRITTYTSTQYLGYLNFPIYERTLRIIRMVLWDEDNSVKHSKEEDPILQDALNMWASNQDKKWLSKESLMKVGNEIAELEKNFYLLRRLITLLTYRYKQTFDKAEETLHQEDWFSGDAVQPNKRFTVFNGIYQSILLSPSDENDEVLIASNSILRQIIVQIADRSELNNPLSLTTTDFRCPHCGKHYNSEKFTGRKTIIKCPVCKRRFIVDCRAFDSLRARKELDTYKDELIRPLRKNYLDSLEKEKSNQYNIGYSEGAVAKEKELTRNFQQKIATLPSLLRWLLGRRLQ